MDRDSEVFFYVQGQRPRGVSPGGRPTPVTIIFQVLTAAYAYFTEKWLR